MADSSGSTLMQQNNISHSSWALPLLAALGTYAIAIKLGPVTLFGFRLWVLGWLTMVLMFPRRLVLENALGSVGTLAMLVAWSSYGIVMLGVAPDLGAGLKEIGSVVFGSLVVVVIMSSAAQLKGDFWIWHGRGWLIAFYVCAGIAIWEIVTLKHLSSAWLDSLPPYFLKLRWAASTLGNPNNYAAFLLLCVPVFIGLRLLRPSRSLVWLSTFALGLIPGLTFFTDSRTGLVGVLLLWTVYFLIRFSRRGRTIMPLVLSLVAVLVGTGMLFSDAPFLSTPLEKLGKFTGGASTTARTNLAINGIEMLDETSGMGYGPGSYEVITNLWTSRKYTGKIINPHNFWIELSSQYGALIFLLFLVWFSFVASTGIQAIKSDDAEVKALGTMTLLFIVAFNFVAVAGSAFIDTNVSWVTIGLMSALAVRIETRLRGSVTIKSMQGSSDVHCETA